MSTTDYLHKVFKTTDKREIGIYITSALSVVSAIITTIGIIQFWKLRSYPFIKKRHPSLVLITSICLILTLFIEKVLSGFARLSSYTSIELQWIRWVLSIILSETQNVCILFRIYITCFDITYYKANAASLWIKYIDINSECKTSSWIVSNYHKYSNLYKIYKFIIGLIVFLILITIILSIFDFNIAFLFNGIIMILLTIIMCILWCMTPKYLDHFKIRVEIRMILLIEICITIINLIYFIMIISRDSIQFKQWFIIHCFLICLLSILSFIQTLWVLYKFNKAKKKELMRVRENSSTESSFHKNDDDDDDDIDEDDIDILELDIIDIIGEQIGFEAFMNHLTKEFSMENLLGIIEMTQYKERYREIRKIKNDIKNGIDPLEDGRGSKKITKIMFKVIKSLSVGQQNENEEEEGNIGITPWNEEENNNKIDIVDEEEEMVININDKDDDTTETEIEREKEEKQTLKKSKNIDIDKNIHKNSKNIGILKRNATLINVTEQTVNLPKTVPFSTIVYGINYNVDDEENNIKIIKNINLEIESIRIIKLIFNKYIFVGSEMELNLSHRLRRRCLDKLLNIDLMNDIELEHMFDRCIASLLKLMQDSYLRFKETKEFIRYQEKAKKRIRNDSLVRKENLGGIFGDLM